MDRRRWVLLLGVAVGVLATCAATAQEYALQGYMPQTVGSQWTMKSTGPRGEETLQVVVTQLVDMQGQKVPEMVTKAADGTPRRGSLELVTADSLTIYGMLFGGRGGGALTTVAYDPPAVFPGTMKVLDTAEATYKTTMRNGQVEVTMKLELAAVEDVTVPKGTFTGCLKLVYTTSFAGGPEMKRTVWYAPGVGAVKTEQAPSGNRPGSTTELVDYKLAP